MQYADCNPRDVLGQRAGYGAGYAVPGSMNESENSGPVVLAIDVGTSSSRVGIYDARGDLMPGTLAAAPHTPVTTPDGGSELDADALVEEVCALIDRSLTGGAGSEPTAVATCSFWHSVVGVDRRRAALTPVYTWADNRAAATLPELARRVDARDLYDCTACPLHPSYLPAKLFWLRQTEPALFGRVVWWVSPGEYLHLQLLGDAACGEAMASATGLYDQRARAWHGPILEALNISPADLSPLVPISRPSGSLRREHADRWPQLARAVWYPAIGDGACSNFGSGAGRPGVGALNYGTSGAIRTVVTEPVRFPDGLWLYRIDEGRLLLGGAVSNAGNVYAWLLQTLELEPEEVERHMRRAEPGATGLEFVPHLSGERSPGWHANATGSLTGMRLDTSREEILQAGVEGVLIELLTVHNMLSETVELPYLNVSGGAVAKSAALRAGLTDALGRPIRVCTESEATLRGAALLALDALGTLDASAVGAELSSPCEPDPRRHAIYRKLERERTARRPGYTGLGV